MYKRFGYLAMTAAMAVLMIACGSQTDSDSADSKTALDIDYEKYTLDNGLAVILHKDTSDPIVSVAINFHVGSNREEKGRTGFAHLFEHMLFQESQHVPQDTFFRKIQDAGGTLNGGTWKDGTIYYEVVPKNALEMVLWLESDRLGWVLPTVTQAAFQNQQDVVQNEKRQRVDNRPYGHTSYVIDKNLYPENHPYNWQVIGSFQDLASATLEDIHDFHHKWYGPNNATLVIAGDYDTEQTKAWIEKYFGEIPASDPVDDPQPHPVRLEETVKVYHEDAFAPSPELNMVFPSVEQYNDDQYPLDVLAQLLGGGKSSPLYKVIVEEKKLAPSVSVFQDSGEMAGAFRVRIRTFPGKNLTDVENAILEAFQRFETDKFTDKDLQRVKAQLETQFYLSISSVLGKSFQLAQYNEYAGSPDYLMTDLEKSVSVKEDGVWRVYNSYVKDKPYVLTSFVPKGNTDLVAEGSERFPVEEESIDNAGVEAGGDAEATTSTIEKLPTSFDRTVEPPKGPDPVLSVPDVWRGELSNGAQVMGIVHDELPLVQFGISIQGGMMLDDPNKIGVANLLSSLMMEGTQGKTSAELEEAIDLLGASISMFTTQENLYLRGTCLRAKFQEVLALVEEILLQPRWDEKEFARLKEETIENINRSMSQPNDIASSVFDKLIYGDDNILRNDVLGTKASVEAITIDDLKAYYNANLSPKVASFQVVGAIDKTATMDLLVNLAENWQGGDVTFPSLSYPEQPSEPEFYFVDVPDAKQSEIRVGYLSQAYSAPNYYDTVVMNYKLGGSFNSVVNMILREEKGYTYGARSSFDGSRYRGPFVVSTAVRSNATQDSVKIIRDAIAEYKQGISEEDLSFTKNALIKSNARRFETLGALLNMLNQIYQYNLPDDYIKQHEQTIQDMTLERHQELAQEYLPSGMFYLVVGDAKTQMAPLADLNLGTPTKLDRDGNPVESQ